MRRSLPILGTIVLITLVVLAMSMFTVDQRDYAIVFQFGEIKKVITEPGLAFKWPLIQNVRYFDRRILTYDAPEPESFMTAENKPVLVDAYVKWRIIDPRQYYISVQGDEQQADVNLSKTVNSDLRNAFGTRTVHEVISGERDQVMDEVRTMVDQYAHSIGIEVVDVRLKRVDLPEAVSKSVYRRMESERKRLANQLRATGAADAEKIRADADRQREVIVAQAFREAQQIKGAGDAKATTIYAQAFSKNPEFYDFYRSLQAYRDSFNKKSDVLLVGPNSEFFKYLKSSGKGRK